MNFNFVFIICRICGKKRKAIENTPRHLEKICGNCWDWEKFPPTHSPEYVDPGKYKPRYPEDNLPSFINS